MIRRFLVFLFLRVVLSIGMGQLALAANSSPEMISLEFQSIPIRSALAMISQFAGINIVVSRDVSGDITLGLKNVTWQQAFDLILKNNGLGQILQGNTILVAPIEEVMVQKKQQLTTEKDLQALIPLKTIYLRLNYAKATNIAALIKDNPKNSLLSERGHVSVDKRTNTLIVQDIQASLDNIQKMIQHLDVPVEQVMIEGRIINIDTSFERDLGIRWGITKPNHVSGTLEGANSLLNNALSGKDNPAGQVDWTQRLNVDLAASIADYQTPSVGIALAKLGDDYLLDLELSAIEAEGGGELISSPRLVTANQHPAFIESGTEIPYEESTSSGATATSFKKAVLSLKVTPQITPNNKIIMDIKVNQDKVDPTIKTDRSLAIDTREISTNVLVKNGQTIVLGGIYEEEKSKQVVRVPFLGSIPVLGYFFRNTDQKRSRRELLIFITPKIVSNQNENEV